MQGADHQSCRRVQLFFFSLVHTRTERSGCQAIRWAGAGPAYCSLATAVMLNDQPPPLNAWQGAQNVIGPGRTGRGDFVTVIG